MFTSTYFALTTAFVVAVLLLLMSHFTRRDGALKARHVPRLVMVGALVVGTCSHVENMLRAGFVPLPQQPLAFNAYWTALTLVDPLGALLLVVRPRIGLMLTAAIMISDLTVNAIAFRGQGLTATSSWPFWMQLGFGLFVLSSLPYAWRVAGSA